MFSNTEGTRFNTASQSTKRAVAIQGLRRHHREHGEHPLFVKYWKARKIAYPMRTVASHARTRALMKIDRDNLGLVEKGFLPATASISVRSLLRVSRLRRSLTNFLLLLL